MRLLGTPEDPGLNLDIFVSNLGSHWIFLVSTEPIEKRPESECVVLKN